MIELLLDNSEKPRICPVCAKKMDSKVCLEHNIKTFSMTSAAGHFIELLDERDRLANSELLKFSKLGYDLRSIMGNVKDRKNFVRDMQDFFLAIEEVTQPKLFIFSKDHRYYGDIFVESFENFKNITSAESIMVDGNISTTASLFLGGVFSQSEKKQTTLLHTTASHNPPEYNGIKVSYGQFKGNIFPEIEFSERISDNIVIDKYVDWMSQVSPYKKKIAFDLVNGAANFVMPKLAKKLYPKAVFYQNKVSPDFGGIKPEPKVVVDWKEFGFGFDGDADRSPMYVNSKMVLFSKFLAGMIRDGQFNEKKVVSDQRTPPQIIEFIENLGVKVVVGSIGRPNQQVISKKEDALWFEENWHSGGYTMNGQRFVWSEAPFCVAFWLDKLKNPIEKVLEGIPEFEQHEDRYHVAPGFNEKVTSAAEKLGLKFSLIPPDGGIRIQSEKGHVLLRESNTELGTVKVFATGVNKEELSRQLNLGRKIIGVVKRDSSN